MYASYIHKAKISLLIMSTKMALFLNKLNTRGLEARVCFPDEF